MYAPLLANRYLTSRIIPMIAATAVALCVALVIIVVSVMTGFLDMVRTSGKTLIGDVVADSFCYSMVRNLVGAVVCVADGRFAPEWIEQTLANKVRISDSLVFPACGLTLRQVDYPSVD